MNPGANGQPQEPTFEPAGPRTQIDIPTPQPVADGEVRVEGWNQGGRAFVRLAFVSPAFGVVFAFIPAESADQFGGMVAAVGRQVKTGLIVPP